MSLHNCKQCGMLFLRMKSDYCESCRKKQDETYFRLREFLKTKPKSTMLEIHEHTGIPLSKLLELRKEEYTPFGR